MKIEKNKVLKILEYLDENKDFYFPFEIICTDFNEDDELFEVDCLEIEIDYINNNEQLNNFILVENLQNLDEETLKLMSKGFMEKIENSTAIEKISDLAIKYRKTWKKELCESESIEDYGLNEFIGGKAEGFEESVKIIKETLLIK